MSNKNKYTAADLAYRQRLPLEIKERMAMTRLREAIHEFGIDGIYEAFSGGKDSTVLSDLLNRTLIDLGYEDTVSRVFANTGLEWPSIRTFALSHPNVVQVRPEKTFKQILIEYGYPVMNKKVAECVEATRAFIRKAEKSDYKKYKFNLPFRALRMLGEVPHTEHGEMTDEYSKMYDDSRWQLLLDAPFKISSKCCLNFKEKPMAQYAKKTGKIPIVGTMAEESRQRKNVWIQFGCNSFEGKNPMSRPLSTWTEQDILQYVKKYNLDIAEAYGKIRVQTKDEIEGQMTIQEVLEDYRECKLETTGEKRTGCIFCMFGINADKERFKRLAEKEPTLFDYVMRGGEFNGEYWQPNNEGLGYWFVLEWLNAFGETNIVIPDREMYIEKYSNAKTDEILNGSQQMTIRNKLLQFSKVAKEVKDES